MFCLSSTVPGLQHAVSSQAGVIVPRLQRNRLKSMYCYLICTRSSSRSHLLYSTALRHPDLRGDECAQTSVREALQSLSSPVSHACAQRTECITLARNHS